MIALLTTSVFVAQAQSPVERPEAGAPTIGYPTVQAALEALREKPGVQFRTQDGWLIAEDDERIASYIFVPESHPAYPTVIKRSIVNRDGASYIETAVRCEASKAVCDNFMRQL